MIQIFYGYGKGKTSTLNGQALRLFGAGKKVCIVRFLKWQDSSEDKVIESLGISVHKFHSSPKFVMQMDDNEKDDAQKKANEGFAFIKNKASEYDAILLDEFLDLAASNVNFASPQDLLDLIMLLPKNKEIFISGHIAIKPLFDVADLITHFEKEKHYFDKGHKARKGIEF